MQKRSTSAQNELPTSITIKGIGETYRSDKYEPKKALFVAMRVNASLLLSQHSAEAHFFTIGLGKNFNRSIDQEWKDFGKMLESVIVLINQKFLIAGMIVGIEMYSKNKNRPNSKALRPHAHMIIYTYNCFLNVPIEIIEGQLSRSGFDFKVDHLKSPYDIAKASCYAIKSGKQTILRKACIEYLSIEPVHLVINSNLTDNPMEDIRIAINSNHIPNRVTRPNIFKPTPSVSTFNGDVKMQMAEFLKKMCILNSIGFYNGSIMKRIPPAKFTWVRKAPIESFVEFVARDQLSDIYKQSLYNSAKWIIKEGGFDGSGHPVQTIFPRITVRPNLWEFRNGQVYDCTDGTIINSKIMDPFISCSMYHDCNWDDLPQPSTLIYIVKLLTVDINDAQLLIQTLGGLFHSLDNRKIHRAAWLSGPSNSYKTWFASSFLSNNFNQVLVNVINQNKTEFQYGRLRGLTEGILVLDEFRSENFKRPAQLLGIADGTPMAIDDKYLKDQITEFKGHPFITSNESIQNTLYNQSDKAALSNRFTNTTFYVHNIQQFKEIEKLIDIDPELMKLQWVSFAMYCNSQYLLKRYKTHSQLPSSWTEETFSLKQKVNPPIKRKRGRPRKNPLNQEGNLAPTKRKRGRPPKHIL